MKFAYSVTYQVNDGGEQKLKHTCVLVDKEIQSWEDEKKIVEELVAAERGGSRRWVEVVLMWYSRLPGSDKTA